MSNVHWKNVVSSRHPGTGMHAPGHEVVCESYFVNRSAQALGNAFIPAPDINFLAQAGAEIDALGLNPHVEPDDYHLNCSMSGRFA